MTENQRFGSSSLCILLVGGTGFPGVENVWARYLIGKFYTVEDSMRALAFSVGM
jgi:hypothetical protein